MIISIDSLKKIILTIFTHENILFRIVFNITQGNIVKAEVPLSEMFGYSTSLRSMSQGRATYTMEFEKYAEIPSNIAEELIQKAS